LFGEVASLWAFTGSESDFGIDVEDTAEIGLRFKNGVIGSVHLDFVQRPPLHSLEIIGSTGTIRWNNDKGAVWVYSGEGYIETYPLPPNFERNNLFLAEMGHFIDVAKGNVDPLCTLDDGIWALKLALAVHDSARELRLIDMGVGTSKS
jgi:predicted dehydrogenase